jgi:tight adherence protein B
VAALAALAALLAPRATVLRRRARGRRDERRSVVEACAALAGELRAGRTPAEALAVAAGLASGPTGAALRSAAGTAGWGGDVPAALQAGAAGSAVPEVLGALAACWAVCSAAGSGLAAAVDTVAEGVRARAAQERAVAAVLAGPRASAGLLALLPLAGTALAAGLGARPVHVLLHTPLGLGCLVLGAGLDLLGLLWTRALVTRAAAAAG